jgi:hypothetical protein
LKSVPVFAGHRRLYAMVVPQKIHQLVLNMKLVICPAPRTVYSKSIH